MRIIKFTKSRPVVVATIIGILGIATLGLSLASEVDTIPPTKPAGLKVVATSETTISISWYASTDNIGVDHYNVYRDGTSVATVASSTSPVFSDSGLWPNSTHSYYISALDTSDNSSAVSDLVTGITKIDLTAPDNPTDLKADFDVSKKLVQLTWSAVRDNVAISHYEVYRNLVKFGKVDFSDTQTFSYFDNTAPENKTIKYLVVAVDKFGNQASSNQPQITTDTIPPTTPTALKITATKNNSISLGWTASTDNFFLTSYDIYRNGSKVASQSWASGTTYYAGGLTPCSNYTFYIVAIDATNNRSANSSTVSATTTGTCTGDDNTAPTPPSNLNGKVKSPTQINLNWTGSLDNVGITGYNIYNNNTLIKSVGGSETSIGLTGLSPNTTYNFTVKGIDSSSNSSLASNIRSLKTFASTPGVGAIGGKITASTGGNITGAFVKVINTNRVSSTNSKGLYSLQNLPVGCYYIMVYDNPLSPTARFRSKTTLYCVNVAENTLTTKNFTVSN